MARSSTSVSSLNQQLRALKNRVTWLERALKPVKKKAISPDLIRTRDHAEEKARHEAIMEFYRKRQIESYRRHPDWLKIARTREREVNAFLRSRGLKPEPSSIPAELRQKNR